MNKYITKYKHLISYISISIIIYILLLNLSSQLGNSIGTKYGNWRYQLDTIPYSTHQFNPNPSPQTALLEYIHQATKANWTIAEIEYGWKVLKCESNFKYDAKNPNSTAAGIAQWTIGTWNTKTPPNSDRLDYRLNISLFIHYFLKEPSHWQLCL